MTGRYPRNKLIILRQIIRKQYQMNFAISSQILPKKYASELPPSNFSFDQSMGNKSQQTWFLAPTDPYEISTLINSLKRKNSLEHDGLSSSLTKYIKKETTCTNAYEQIYLKRHSSSEITTNGTGYSNLQS